MATMLKPDNVRANIRYLDCRTDEALSYYGLLRRRPALAMMAAMVSDIIALDWKIPMRAYSVRVYEGDHRVSLQVLQEESLPPKLRRGLDGFIRLMRDTAANNRNVDEWVDSNNQVITSSDRTLMYYLENMFRRGNLHIAPEKLANPEDYHASTSYDLPWQEVALDGLEKSWLLAALPERAYVGEEHLMADAYREMHSASFGFARIEAMIVKSEQDRAAKQDPNTPKPPRDLIFYHH